MPDPSQLLTPETIELLRNGLSLQLAAGSEPVEPLVEAIRVAAREGRDRGLAAEAILIQLKILADEVGVAGEMLDSPKRQRVREWMVGACLPAYWDQSTPGA